MSLRMLPSVLVGLLLVVACGGDDDTAVTERDTSTAAADTSAAAPGLVRHHREAGFQVYWPSGCDKLNEQASGHATRRAAREFIFTCDQDGKLLKGLSIRVLQQAHGRNDTPPGPPLVVSMIEAQVRRFGVQTVRQRPLQSADSEGMDVQAAEPHGDDKLWIRGLLIGQDIYLLMAWSGESDLFEDPETVNFFASFRVDQP